MKSKLLAALVILTIIASPAFSQGVRVNGYALATFDDNVDSYYDANNYYNGTIKGGFQWGVGIEFMLRANQGGRINVPAHRYPRSYDLL